MAYTHIDEEKTTHEYWYARWDGQRWQTTPIAPAGHAFHHNWDKTERCYSGGMAIDPEDTRQLYLSIPTIVGHTSQCDSSDPEAVGHASQRDSSDAPCEIWHYTLAPNGTIARKVPVTSHSAKSNARPYVIPSFTTPPNAPDHQSPNAPTSSRMRLTWMQGDYYYWMVNKWYPKGYPTAILCDAPMLSELENVGAAPSVSPLQEPPQSIEIPSGTDHQPLPLTPGKPLRLTLRPDTAHYAGVLFNATLPHPTSWQMPGVPLTYRINPDDQRPEVIVGDHIYRSQNRLLTSDAWAQHSTGTNGDSHPTKMTTVDLTLCYDGHTLTILRNGFVDQVIACP